MPIEPSLLVLDGSDAPRAALVQRLREMGYRALRAKTPEEAMSIVEEHRHQVVAGLVPPDLAVADLAGALESLALRAPGGRLAWIVTGPCPAPEVLADLRAAGLELALWEPIDDARLRFQVNRVLASRATEALPRTQLRAPLDVPAQVVQAGRRKAARVYTLSTGGVYLDTPRPAMRGASIEVELNLGPSPVCVRGSVEYANVPGNLRRAALPFGMGVRFSGATDVALARIRRAVAEAALQLTL
jgi:CheY-like chemotaxis protein